MVLTMVLEGAMGWVVGLLLLGGALFIALAALGALRMPDLLTRMHATTKASVLGAGLMLLGVALHFGSGEVTLRVIAVVLFVMLTAPVAAHAIGRAGYRRGARLWEGTLKDALANSRGTDQDGHG